MPEIICIECKASVSDESGYCPECGYPFDIDHTVQDNVVSVNTSGTLQESIVSAPLENIPQLLDSVRLEMKDLQKTVDDTKQGLNSFLQASTDNNNKILTEIAKLLDTIASVKSAQEAQSQAEDPKKTKMKLLADFYKTLNSPNSMFEYLFYICVVQIVFVIVNLFLVAYIVTLVKK